MIANEWHLQTGDSLSGELPDGPRPLVSLTGFQRDLLSSVAQFDGTCEHPHGPRIKQALAIHYSDEITTGRLYQNLRELTDRRLVKTHPIDGRTNTYQLTDLGWAALEAYSAWLAVCSRGESDHLSV